MELPRYRCHKEVTAAKIVTVWTNDSVSGGVLVLDLNAPDNAPGRVSGSVYYENRRVSAAYLQKHKPAAGGYFVLYDDGYESFSPAKAFEDGYTIIG